MFEIEKEGWHMQEYLNQSASKLKIDWLKLTLFEKAIIICAIFLEVLTLVLTLLSTFTYLINEQGEQRFFVYYMKSVSRGGGTKTQKSIRWVDYLVTSKPILFAISEYVNFNN